MNKVLLKNLEHTIAGFSRLKTFYFVLIIGMIGLVSNAQTCIGPFQTFESFKAKASMQTDNWTFSASATIASTLANSRSGTTYGVMGPSQYIQTPKIVENPSSFLCYVKAPSITSISYKVEWSTDITFATGVSSTTGLNTGGSIAYIPVFINTSNNSSSNGIGFGAATNIYIRITNTTAGTSLFVDDISWISSDTTKNKTIVPALGSTYCNTIAIGATAGSPADPNFILYDNGGASDSYSNGQNHVLSFQPCAGLNKKIKLTLNSTYTLANSADTFAVYSGTASGAIMPGLVLSAASQSLTAPVSFTSCASDGSLSIQFLSDAATINGGFAFTVECVDYVAPTLISTHPSAATQSVCVGTSATALTVAASGYPSATFQWYSNTSNSNSGGTLISGATNASYTPPSAVGNIGTTYYYCVVSTTCDSQTSTVSGGITVNASPNAVLVSASGTYCDTTTLTASLSGVGTIYWQNTTTGGTSTATPSSSQVITTSGTYYFRAFNAGCWGTEGSAAVTVNYSPVAPPVATIATSVITTSFSANWGAVTNATAYYLDVSTSATFATFVTGYNNLLVGNVVTYSVTGLVSGTTYYYRVRAFSPCATTVSSNVITQATTGVTYCIPNAPGSSSYYINSFATTGGITNITNNSTGFTVGGYANYAGTLSCSQYPTASVGFTITNKNTTGTYYYYLWIDWNNDGDFLDAGETLFDTTANGYAAGPFTGSFTIPALQAAGAYRMRVSNSFIGANTSCTNYGYGEFEDYTLNVITIPPCTVSLPSAITSSNIGGTSATLTWTDASLAPTSVYNYYYNTTGTAPVGATAPNGSVTGTNTVNLSGLTLGANYYCWVRTNCSGTYSAWTGPTTFTTINLDIVILNTSGSLTTCNASFFDSGTSTGVYQNNENYTYTFIPTAGSSLKAVFNSFATENNWDGLVIYNGNSTAAPIISSGLPAGTGSPANCPAGSFYGATSPGTIYSTAADGSLTFQFRSDGSVVRAGWDASLTCVTLPKVTSFTPTSTCAGTYPLVTITGTNFTGATSVKFNGVTAAFTIVNSTTITATLPVGATSGVITVSNAQATGTSATSFVVNPIPGVPNAGAATTICSGSSTVLGGSATGSSTSTALSENFNAGPFPTGWTRTNNDFQTSFEFVSSGNTWPPNGFTGYCSYFWTFVLGNGYSGDMITSPIDMTTYTASTLSFWIYNSTGTDTLQVYANNNGGAYTQVGTTYATYGSWTQITISLNAFVGTGFNAVRIKFTGKGDAGGSNIGIDDILITGDTAPTNTWSPATGLSATNVLNPTASPTTNTTYTLSSTYGNGCSTSNTVAITVNPRPTITASATTPTLCYSASAQTTTLAYSATTNTPTTYSITWNASPTNSFVAVTDVALPGSPITINVPAATASGTYTGNLTVKNANGCVSVASVFTITINAQVAMTTASSATSVCGGIGSTVLSFSSPTGGATTYSITWNASPINTFAPVTDVAIPGGTTIPITIPGGTAAGTYTGNISVKNGTTGCVGAAIPFTVTISAQPTVILAASAAQVCFSSTAQTTTIAYNTPFGSPTVYTLTWSGAAPGAGFVNLGNTALPPVIGTAPITINVPANAPAATYTGAIIVKNAGACASPSMSFTVKVNSKPTITSAFELDPLCVSSTAQTASLSYSASTNAPTSYSIDWNAAANTAGLTDQGVTAYAFINGDDTISNINIPANLPPNRYTGTINIMNANGCANSYTVTLYMGKVWNGITSSDWATATNWYPNGEPTSGDYCVYVPSGTPNNPVISADAFSGDLTINTGATVTVNSGFVLEIQDFVKTDGTLTVNDDASLVQVNDVPNSGAGSMVYKRNVTGLNGYDYIYWSSPVVSQVLSSLYSSPAIGPRYFWDTLVNNGNGTGGNTSQGNWANATSTMDIGRGYIVRASSSYGWSGSLTSTFTGTPNNGTLTLPLHRGSYQGAIPYLGVNGMSITNKDDNHNLIGNPYPSALDAISFLTLPSNASKIEGFVYLWTHGTTPSSTSNPFYSSYSSNYYLSDYLIYNSLGSSSIPAFNGKIAGGQGFFVTMLDGNTVTDSSELVTFDNTMRSAAYGNSQFYKSSQVAATQTASERHRIWIDLIDSNNNSTRTLVGYAAGATNGKDRMYDAFTKVGGSNIIYSRSGDENLVIQGRGLPFDENDQVSIGFNATTNGNYTIAIGTVDGLFEQAQPIYLEDKVLNIIYDLRQAPYSFTTAAGTFNDRFILRYTNSALSVNQFNITNVAATVIKGQLQIKANTAIDHVHVFDITGKLVKIYNPAEKTTDLREDFSFEKGVYFAKIKLIGGDLVTQKIMN